MAWNQQHGDLPCNITLLQVENFPCWLASAFGPSLPALSRACPSAMFQAIPLPTVEVGLMLAQGGILTLTPHEVMSIAAARFSGWFLAWTVAPGSGIKSDQSGQQLGAFDLTD